VLGVGTDVGSGTGVASAPGTAPGDLPGTPTDVLGGVGTDVGLDAGVGTGTGTGTATDTRPALDDDHGGAGAGDDHGRRARLRDTTRTTNQNRLVNQFGFDGDTRRPPRRIPLDDDPLDDGLDDVGVEVDEAVSENPTRSFDAVDEDVASIGADDDLIGL